MLGGVPARVMWKGAAKVLWRSLLGTQFDLQVANLELRDEYRLELEMLAVIEALRRGENPPKLELEKDEDARSSLEWLALEWEPKQQRGVQR